MPRILNLKSSTGTVAVHTIAGFPRRHQHYWYVFGVESPGLDYLNRVPGRTLCTYTPAELLDSSTLCPLHDICGTFP